MKTPRKRMSGGHEMTYPQDDEDSEEGEEDNGGKAIAGSHQD